MVMVLYLLFYVISTESSPLIINDNESKLSTLACFGTAALFIPAGLVMINNHEVGHTVIAFAAGDKNAHYSLFGRESFFDYTKLSRLDNALAPMGGVIFSELLAQGCDYLNGTVAMPDFMHRFLSVMYLIGKFDMLMQTEEMWTNSHRYKDMKESGAPCGTDFVDFSFYLSNGNRDGFNSLRIGLNSLSVLSWYFSWNTIKKNWDIVTGKKIYRKQ